jgi:hypothetical protein
MALLLKDVSSASRNENAQEGTNESNEGILKHQPMILLLGEARLFPLIP